ncbi:MAG: ribosome maturation factor RimP [Parvularculaceae bacterium]
MTPLEEKLRAIVAPVVADAGFRLVRVRVTGDRVRTAQIMAERPDRTMTAEDCARLSRLLSPVLEEADPIAGAYNLEVSSPGVDRPLVSLEDFDAWRGYEAKVELDRLIEGRRRFRGVLAGVEDDQVLIDLDGETETALIPYAYVDNAKLVLTDALVRESLAAAKALERARAANGVADNDDSAAEGAGETQ